jgi:ATP-dependent 26S proteasome regulatory subunit
LLSLSLSLYLSLSACDGLQGQRRGREGRIERKIQICEQSRNQKRKIFTQIEEGKHSRRDVDASRRRGQSPNFLRDVSGAESSK